MKLYKLMRPNHTTRKWQKWELGVHVEKAPCDDPQLCSSDVLHAYINLNLAFLLTYLHNTGDYTVAVECEGDVVVSDWAKVGCFAITPVRWIEKPAWVGSEYDTQVRVAFAMLCAEAVIDIYNAEYPSDNRPQRAIEITKAWLANPSTETAARVVSAADAASDAADAAYSATYAAYSATYAARAAGARTMGAAAAAAGSAASYAARASAAARATDAASDAAYAAARAAARAAGRAASSAARAFVAMDFAALADEAVRMAYNARDVAQSGQGE